MDILRFLTAGDVDDGKSTLIGRLLYDSKNIVIDQLETIERQSKNKEEGEIDLALLTDGLRAEREQGITIDVAYRYFTTPVRKFIIADAPGHVQYTRNMVTGASNADMMIVLVDARHGVTEQTRRHSLIASLLRLPQIFVAINKMDLVDYSQDVYNNIVIAYAELAKELGMNDIKYIPISALHGDNIVALSKAMPWYEGESLLTMLETKEVRKAVNLEKPRFPVQYVIRPQTEDLHDYRGYAGKIISGMYKRGEEVTVLPSGLTSRIKAIEIDGGRRVSEAFAPQSIVLHLEDELDISRGDVIVVSRDLPKTEKDLEAMVCWMDNKPLRAGNKYFLQMNSSRVRVVVKDLNYRMDVNAMGKIDHPEKAELNDIVSVSIRASQPVVYDSFSELRVNGGGILIDETSNVTVGACMIR